MVAHVGEHEKDPLNEVAGLIMFIPTTFSLVFGWLARQTTNLNRGSSPLWSAKKMIDIDFGYRYCKNNVIDFEQKHHLFDVEHFLGSSLVKYSGVLRETFTQTKTKDQNCLVSKINNERNHYDFQ